jgi:hypothetical protein
MAPCDGGIGPCCTTAPFFVYAGRVVLGSAGVHSGNCAGEGGLIVKAACHSCITNCTRKNNARAIAATVVAMKPRDTLPECAVCGELA